MEVRDTGPGILTDRLEAVFEPFTQGDASVTRAHGGTGSGLAISRRIADGLGGSRTAESQIGWGSAFTLRVAAGDPTGVPTRPTPTAEVVAPADAGDGGPAGDAGDSPAGTPRALLVEDGAMYRTLFRVVPARGKIVPTEACDGRAGVDAALAAHAMTGERERRLAAGCGDDLTKPMDTAELPARVAAAAPTAGPVGVAGAPRDRAERFAAGLAA